MPYPTIGTELHIKDDDDNLIMDVEVVELIAQGKAFRVRDTTTMEDKFLMITAEGRVFKCIDIDSDEDKEPWQL